MNSKGDTINNHPFQCIKQQRNNFNQNQHKQRSSSTHNMIQLSQYFAKRNTNPHNTYHPSQQTSKPSKEKQLERSPHSMKLLPHFENHKQNVCPNTNNSSNLSHLNSKKKEMGAGKSNQKKVITIRSNIKNSKNKKSFDQSFNGFSTEKRSITESMGYETQIRAFDTEQNHGGDLNGYFSCQHSEQQLAPNNKKDFSPQKKPPVIQVDLYKHRKSIQDTLVSSNTMTLDSIGSNHEKPQYNRRSCGDNKSQPIEQQPLCSKYHERKKAAIFLVKGKPYCEKCAAPFITNGQLAVRIRPTDLASQKNIFDDYDKEEKNRNLVLSAFIESLDMIGPRLEDLQEAVINDIVPIIYQQYSKYYLQLNQWKQEAVQAINHKHSSLMEDLSQSHNQILQNLELIKTKIEEELKKLKFMRNDIIENIKSILKPDIVQSNKFARVIGQFEDDLKGITLTQEQIESTKVSIPIISRWSRNKLNEALDQAVFIEYEVNKQQYLFELKCDSQENRNTGFKTKKASQENEDIDKPHRLSFGKQLEIYEHKEDAQSPTFKMI